MFSVCREITSFLSVLPGSNPDSADAIVERLTGLGAWLSAIKTRTVESETSCELMALEMLRRGSPLNPAHTSDEIDDIDS